MEFRQLGETGVSVIGLGTLRTFDVTEESEVFQRQQIINNCVANRINIIDSSPFYGQAERVVGQTTAGIRDKFFLATKVRVEGKEAGENQIAESFELFGTDFIDLFQIHNMIDWRTHLPTLERLKAEGKIGMIGVTAMVHEAYPEIASLMREGRIDAVQLPYNVVERGCEELMLPLAEALGIGFLVMEPLKKGAYVKELKSQPDLTPLAELGVETWAQALLAWVVSDPRVTTAIPATSRPGRIAENAKAGSIGPLPPELRDYVREETLRCL